MGRLSRIIILLFGGLNDVSSSVGAVKATASLSPAPYERPARAFSIEENVHTLDAILG